MDGSIEGELMTEGVGDGVDDAVNLVL